MKQLFTISPIILLLIHQSLFSQIKSNPHFTHLTTQNGLSNNWVNCIAQDKTGFIWIGTQDGLNRYDSRHFKIYKHNPKNKNSLTDNNILGIAFDKNGQVWVGTVNGLCSIDPQTDSVTRYTKLPGQNGGLSNHQNIRPFVDQQDNLWVGTDSGFNYFDRNTKTFISYYISSPSEEGTQTFSNSIRKIIEDDQHNLWCLGLYKLCLFDKKNRSFTSYSTPLTGVNFDIVNKDAGTFYISQWAGGLYEFNIISKKFSLVSINDPAKVFLSLFYDDQKNKLYIGNNETGVIIYDPQQQQQSTFRHKNYQASSIITDQVFTIFKDQEQSLWFATSKGISILNPQLQLFKNYLLGDNFFPGEAEKFGLVNTYYEDDDRHLLEAWPYTALYEFDRDWSFINKMIRIPPTSKSYHSQFINDIYRDKNIAWFSTDSGLVKYNTTKHTFQVFIPADADSSIHKEHLRIRKTLPISNNRFIIRTWKWGIYIFDAKKEQFTEHFQYNPSNPAGLADVHTFDMIALSNGDIYISTLKGLNLFRPEEKIFFTYRANDNEDNVTVQMRKICSDEKENLWITSSSGIYYFDRDKKQFTRHSIGEGLPVEKTNSICLDKKGKVWISTNVGISRFDPVTKQFLNFTMNDGLPAEIYDGTLSLMNDGNILAGFEGGITIINPDEFTYNSKRPAVVVNEVHERNTIIPYEVNDKDEKTIHLSYRQNSIRISFSVLNFTNPQQNKFYYKLDGFDREWQSSADGNISYTNLHPGNYILKVKGANNSGVMNEEGDKLFISIKPAIWQTNWFRIAIGLLVAGFVFWFFRRRIQTVRHQAELKQKIAETEMMALRAQMNPHFIFNSLNSIDNLIQTDQKEKATTYLARFAKLIRGILENSKQEVIPCWKDLELLQLYLELEKLRWDNKFTSEVQIDDRIIHGDYKVPPLVIQPFVENAIHHGLLNKKENDRRLFISVTPENGQIKYIIEDNGVGRAKAEEYKKVNRPSHLSMGLNITEQRINLFNKTENGSIQITDLTGKENEATGTRVEIILNNQV